VPEVVVFHKEAWRRLIANNAPPEQLAELSETH
jgi:hypothetical protein